MQGSLNCSNRRPLEHLEKKERQAFDTSTIRLLMYLADVQLIFLYGRTAGETKVKKLFYLTGV
jgi:hypothetical protein